MGDLLAHTRPARNVTGSSPQAQSHERFATSGQLYSNCCWFVSSGERFLVSTAFIKLITILRRMKEPGLVVPARSPADLDYCVTGLFGRHEGSLPCYQLMICPSEYPCDIQLTCISQSRRGTYEPQLSRAILTSEAIPLFCISIKRLNRPIRCVDLVDYSTLW